MTNATKESIQQNIALIREAIADRCARVGRSPSEIKLIAVSKQHDVQAIQAAHAAGIQHFGENRVEEAVQKIAAFESPASKIQWHMIGHVQSRKARDVLRNFDVVHSVDSLKLAQRLDRFASEAGCSIEVLLQVNTSGETSKSGLEATAWQRNANQHSELWSLVEAVLALENLHVVGLMTMALHLDNMEALRPYFASTRELFLALQEDFPEADWRELSMGMTNDYLIAIEEGATMLRIGRAIFGARSY